MSVDWDGYTLEHYGVPRPLAPTPAATEARAAYDRLLASKSERLERLRLLLAANGVPFGTQDKQLQAINDWFRAEVEPDPSSSRTVDQRWWSVIRDLGLLLGDAMIERYPGLEWRFYDRRPEVGVGFRRPVIMGFPDPPLLRVSGTARLGLRACSSRDVAHARSGLVPPGRRRGRPAELEPEGSQPLASATQPSRGGSDVCSRDDRGCS